MKCLYRILWYAYVGLLASCTYHFKLDDMAVSPKLVLYSYPGAGDTTVVHLSRSLPLNQKGEIESGLRDAEVSLTVNDKTTRLAWTNDSIPGVPARSYYAVQKYKDGDRVSISVAAGDQKVASSGTVIPPPFPLESIELVQKPENQGTIQFRICFTDDVSTRNWYALQVEQKQMYWSNDVYTETVSSIKFDLDDEPLLHTSSGLDDILMIENEFYRNLYFWNDEKIQGKRYTLRLNTNFRDNYENDFITPDGFEHIKSVVKYRVIMYSLSEEFYRYLKSLNDQKNNTFGSSELAPIRATYTNVKNGIGIVGGCRIFQTQWLDNLQKN